MSNESKWRASPTRDFFKYLDVNLRFIFVCSFSFINQRLVMPVFVYGQYVGRLLPHHLRTQAIQHTRSLKTCSLKYSFKRIEPATLR